MKRIRAAGIKTITLLLSAVIVLCSVCACAAGPDLDDGGKATIQHCVFSVLVLSERKIAQHENLHLFSLENKPFHPPIIQAFTF